MSRADALAVNDKKVHDLVLRGTTPQFDSSEALATTAHVQRSLGSYAGQVNYPRSTVLTAADVGMLVNFPQESIATLPLASGVPPGALITIGCSLSGAVTVKPQGTDILTNLLTTQGPFVIPMGTLGVFRRLLAGGGWSFDSGDAALKFSPSLADVVRRAQGSYADSRGVGAATQLTVTDVGLSIGLGGLASYVVTLPDVNDVPPGAAIGLHCRNAAGVTIASKTGNQISPQGAYLSTITMAAGESAEFVREGSIWVVYGLAALKYSQLVSANTGETGFMRHPCGMIEQWGIGTTDSSGSVYVTFPVAWPVGLRNISLLHLGTAGLMGCVVAPTKTGCTLRVRDDQGIATANWFLYWRALGL